MASPRLGRLRVNRDRALSSVATRFVLVSALLTAFIAVVASFGAWRGLTVATAKCAAVLTSLSGVNAWASGANIVTPGRILVVDLNCTAIYVTAVFVALVVSYPINPRTRAIGIAIGVPLILGANLIRLMIAAQVSEHAPRFFDFSHDYLYQVGLVMVVAVTWALWLSYARMHAR